MGVRINGVWREDLPDPGTGGSDNGNGRNYGSAADYSNASGSGVGTTTASPTAKAPGAGGVTAQEMDAQFQKMLGALASGNREAFEFEKQKFNQQFDESKRQFDLGRDDQLAQFARGFGLDEAAVTGMYNGQRTEEARQFDISSGQARARDQADLGTSLLNAATNIRGPKDYLQYQELTRGGQSLMQQLYGDQQIPQGGAPTGQLQSANLQGVLGDLGWNPGAGMAGGAQQQAPMGMGDNATGMVNGQPTHTVGQLLQMNPVLADPNYQRQLLADRGYVFWQGENLGANGRPTAGATQVPMPQQQAMPQQQVMPQQAQQPDPRQQLLQRFGLSQGGSQQLSPTQIDPARWDAMGAIGQDLTKNLAETQFGYDAADFEAQINKTRPIGTAARTTRSTYAQPRGLF